jgi:hypothetical protein
LRRDYPFNTHCPNFRKGLQSSVQGKGRNPFTAQACLSILFASIRREKVTLLAPQLRIFTNTRGIQFSLQPTDARPLTETRTTWST